MSELTREKIYKKELIAGGATGNNNLERIRSLAGGSGKKVELLETKIPTPVRNPLLVRIDDEIFILGGITNNNQYSSNIYAFNIKTKEIRYISNNFPKIVGGDILRMGDGFFWIVGGNIDGVTSNKIYSWTYEPQALNNYFREVTEFALDENESITKAVKYGTGYFIFCSSKRVYKLERIRQNDVYYPNDITFTLYAQISESYTYNYGTYITRYNDLNNDFRRIGGGSTYSVDNHPMLFYIKDGTLNTGNQNPFSFDISISEESQVRWLSKDNKFYCFISGNSSNDNASYAEVFDKGGSISGAQTITTTKLDIPLPKQLTLIETEYGIFGFGGTLNTLPVDSIYKINVENL